MPFDAPPEPTGFDERGYDLEAMVRHEVGKCMSFIVEKAVAETRHMMGEDASRDLQEVLELATRNALALAGDSLPVEMVRKALRVLRPDDPAIDQVAEAGRNREQDYIWARPADIGENERLPNGMLKPGVVLRIMPAFRLHLLLMADTDRKAKGPATGTGPR